LAVAVIVVAVVVLSGSDAKAAIDEPDDALSRIDVAAPKCGVEGVNGIAVGFVCCSLIIIRVVSFQNGLSMFHTSVAISWVANHPPLVSALFCSTRNSKISKFQTMREHAVPDMVMIRDDQDIHFY
jgi:hypothetical protein